MANFFETRREQLGLNRTQIAARIGTVAETVRLWEDDKQYPARTPIAILAKGYETTEQQMADEVMALRVRIEKRDAKLATAK